MQHIFVLPNMFGCRTAPAPSSLPQIKVVEHAYAQKLFWDILRGAGRATFIPSSLQECLNLVHDVNGVNSWSDAPRSVNIMPGGFASLPHIQYVARPNFPRESRPVQ